MPASFHRLWNICDKSFDTERSSNYELSILLSQDGVSFSVAEPHKGRVVAFESASFFSTEGNKVLGWNQVMELLAAERSGLKLLDHQYIRRRIFVETRKSTLVPLLLAQESAYRDILGFNHPLEEQEVVVADSVAAGELVHLFALPDVTMKAIGAWAGSDSLHCASSVLLELLIGQFKNLKLDDKIFVHVRPGWFELVYLREKKLRFFNTFEYKTREDFAYYLLFVMEQLGLNPETTETVLLGEIEKESSVYQVVHRYVRNVGFARRLTALTFPYGFDELPRHSYFTILNTSLCEL